MRTRNERNKRFVSVAGVWALLDVQLSSSKSRGRASLLRCCLGRIPPYTNITFTSR